MAITTFQRKEMKFILEQEQFDALLPKLSQYMELDKYCRNGENYRIYNLYYDTLDNELIRESLAKPYYKEKLRLRSYNIPSSKNDQVFLEIKKKVGGIVNKRRAILSLEEAYLFLDTRQRPKSLSFLDDKTESEAYINHQVLNEIEYLLDNRPVLPKVCINYERLAFFGKENPDFRITFDFQITSRRHKLGLEKEEEGELLLNKGQYLMEVKVQGTVPLWLSKALSQLGIYSTSFSKYGFEYKKTCTRHQQSFPQSLWEEKPSYSYPRLCVG